MLIALALVSQLALARGPLQLPAILPNDNRTAAGQARHGILPLRLKAEEGLWFPEGPRGPGIRAFAFAVEGKRPQAPGPMIRVSAGTEIRLSLHNALGKPLVLRGLQDHAAAEMDTIEIAAGATREVRFTPATPGTYFYWGRTDESEGMLGSATDALLTGAFIVTAPGARVDPAERVMVINVMSDTIRVPGLPSRPDGIREILTINGLSWPYTERLDYAVGDSVHWRVINASVKPHPMHLHGFYFTVRSRGDASRDTTFAEAWRRQAVTEFMQPGTTMSLAWLPTRPGNWLFHCHLIFHIDSRWRLAPPSEADHANHALGAMSGLVMGIRVSRNQAIRRQASRRPVARCGCSSRSAPASSGPGRATASSSRRAPRRRPRIRCDSPARRSSSTATSPPRSRSSTGCGRT